MIFSHSSGILVITLAYLRHLERCPSGKVLVNQDLFWHKKKITLGTIGHFCAWLYISRNAPDRIQTIDAKCLARQMDRWNKLVTSLGTKACNTKNYDSIDVRTVRLWIELTNWGGFVASQLPLSRLFVFITAHITGSNFAEHFAIGILEQNICAYNSFIIPTILERLLLWKTNQSKWYNILL